MRHFRDVELSYKFYRNETPGSRLLRHDENAEYILAYSGKVVAKSGSHSHALEDLYETFNINHPDDYHNRSMSVADVVMLEDEISKTWYTCLPSGWAVISKPVNIQEN